jgi:hypothetical protein
MTEGNKMKNLGRAMKRGWLIITLLIGVSILLASQPVQAPLLPKHHSEKVAIIGSPGRLPTSGTDLAGITFTKIAPGSVNAGTLAKFDTVVLNAYSINCDTSTLTAAAKADLVAFVEAGNKMIIYDDVCASSVDYSWLPFSFITDNPGHAGAMMPVSITEENSLSSSDVMSPFFIDTDYLTTKTDAGGDADVMTTKDPKWCVDMTATNHKPIFGPVHAYAKTGTDAGLFIYNGLDLDEMGYELFLPTPPSGLRKIWVQELMQPFNPSSLPCNAPALSIFLEPTDVSNLMGKIHTVTATITDIGNNPQPDISVTFTVNSGPNSGRTSTGFTLPDGKADFSYGSIGTGTDEIKACFTSQPLHCSSVVTKNWTSTTQVPNGTISGTKFNDRNDNGILDSLDATLEGWTIRLKNSAGEIIAETNTDVTGNYKFSVPPGIYTAEEVLQPGWKQTAPTTGTYSIYAGSGELITFQDFGNNRACLSIQAPNQIDVNSIVQLDSSNTCGFGNFLYQWIILAKPEGSKANLPDVSAVHIKFVADLPGEYAIQLTIKDVDTGSESVDGVIIKAVPAPGVSVPAISTIGIVVLIGMLTITAMLVLRRKVKR